MGHSRILAHDLHLVARKLVMMGAEIMTMVLMVLVHIRWSSFLASYLTGRYMKNRNGVESHFMRCLLTYAL